jgi:hypothetical protein
MYGTCSTHRRGEEITIYRVLVGKKPLGRQRRRWENGIRMDLMEIGWGRGVEWIELFEDSGRWRALVNKVMNMRVLAPRS